MIHADEINHSAVGKRHREVNVVELRAKLFLVIQMLKHVLKHDPLCRVAGQRDIQKRHASIFQGRLAQVNACTH